jgi:hypothetical protein
MRAQMANAVITGARLRAGQARQGSLSAARTHNPPVLGSSPSRPTVSKSWSRPPDLRIRPPIVILPRCARMRLCAVGSGQMQVAVPDTCPSSVLLQGLADPALGELVLADNALGVDPQQYVHAVPGPLRDLRRVDAAVEPRGQTRVA